MAECISCLSPHLKSLLKEHTHPQFHQQIDEFPTCGIGMVVQLCPDEEATPKRRRGEAKSGAKRPRSAYQEFVSQCMKSKPIKGKPFGAASSYMKECAEAWKKQRKGAQ